MGGTRSLVGGQLEGSVAKHRYRQAVGDQFNLIMPSSIWTFKLRDRARAPVFPWAPIKVAHYEILPSLKTSKLHDADALLPVYVIAIAPCICLRMVTPILNSGTS